MHKSYPSLYNLIASLTEIETEKLEQEGFKQNSKEHQLYSFIKTQCKEMIEPDEEGFEALKDEMKDSKDLRSLLRDTKNKLLEILDEWYASQDTAILKVRKLLNRATYLLDKELYDLANESWQEAKDLAMEHKLYDEYTRIYRLGFEHSFRSKSPNLKEDIKDFADLAFNLGEAITTNASSAVVFGSKEEVVSELRNHYTEEYQKLIKSLDKAKEKALQEEVMQAFGLILQHHIKDRLHHEPISLAKETQKDFYQDWFYRLIFMYLCLNHQDERFFFDIYEPFEDIYQKTPAILLPAHEQNSNEDNLSNAWEVINHPYINAWWLLQNFELFYYSFSAGYEERAKLALERIKQHISQNAFTNPIKYSALGYFLVRKIASLEIALKLKSGEGLTEIKSIANTMPQDLVIFSEAQITKTALRYELNLILLKFLATYGNGQKGERKALITHINDLLKEKGILKNFPEQEADLSIMLLFCENLTRKGKHIEPTDDNINIESSIRKLQKFLKSNYLDKDFRQLYFEMLRKAIRSKTSFMDTYNKFKDKIEDANKALNPFHIALCEVIKLNHHPF